MKFIKKVRFEIYKKSKTGEAKRVAIFDNPYDAQCYMDERNRSNYFMKKVERSFATLWIILPQLITGTNMSQAI